MPVILLKTASKQLQNGFQVAKQRFSDSFSSDRMTSRVSSFDSYSSGGTPQTVKDTLFADAILEGSSSEQISDSFRRKSSRHSIANPLVPDSSILSSPRPKRTERFFDVVSPARLTNFFRPKEFDTPSPTAGNRKIGDRNVDMTTNSKETPTSIAYVKRLSSDSLMSDEVEQLGHDNNETSFSFPILPSLDTRSVDTPVSLQAKPEDRTFNSNNRTPMDESQE